jgi:hypothetical protein
MKTISDEGLVDLYWTTSGDDWAIPDWLMVKFGRKVAAEALRQAADDWAEDPDAWGDNEKDFRNELRDRADVLERLDAQP